ncbi:TonB-dependent hemoglobin/transferrin/lactoferrin family receptor [Otariodibacter oris]|uniref:Hemoglobin/transferrin/lactoferrin receptor protein n=1 Tax=Otariodibacter oris TaxID=1032623 RepID=A0A420XG26_9PAST|nr:TonB-dependent hemoglobin/transferrin/lactoferrin family receptor [Otariodibacter oris]QGM80311.1 ligand-gated channel [Otariodibacter oris]RKR71679.1 hemoglobin/transferrin/lactoferrin receptor protein [Otariodibacter oris]
MKLSKIYIALFTVAPVIAFAEDMDQLSQIDVVASRDPSVYAESANKIVKVTADQIRSQQAASVADTLKNIANVDIQDGARAIAQKPRIRGLSDVRVAQVIDGVKQTFNLEHRGSYFIPLSLVQEIEVIKGPTSTLWGSGALGGVVAMKTPSALDLLKPGRSFGVKARQGYQSANDLSESELSAFAANDKFDFLVSGYYYDGNNLRLGKGDRLPDSGYTQKGGFAKFGWQIDDANRLELSHRSSILKQIAPSNNETEREFTYDDITSRIRAWHSANPWDRNDPTYMPRMLAFYGGLTSTFGSVNFLSKQKITDQNTTLNYYFNPADNAYIDSQITAFHNRTEEKEERLVNGLNDKTKATSSGVNLRNSSDLGWLSMTYGVDFSRDKVTTQREKNNTSNDGRYRPNPYDAKSNNVGVYLLTHIPLLNDTVILSPSIRYDYFKTKGTTDGEYSKYSDHRWSPATALTWKPTNWLDLTARYTEAFRAPSMQERFISGSHFGMGEGQRATNNIFVVNPNLKPETAKNKEVNANVHFDNVLIQNDKVVFDVTYFQNDVKNFINLDVFKATPRETIPSRSQYKNINNARLRGVEVEGSYQTDRLAVIASYGLTRGKDKNTGEALQNIGADKVSLAVNYELLPDQLTVGSRVTHYAKQKRVPENYALTYGSYTLTDLTATYAPQNGMLKDLRVDFAIENLFDKKYRPAFSFMDGVGRNVKVSLAYNF